MSGPPESRKRDARGIILSLRVGLIFPPFRARLVLGGAAFLFLLVAAGVLVSYHIRFSRMIESRMSSQPFNNISYIFAAPKPIFVGQHLFPRELVDYLRQAGYAESLRSGETGQFLVTDSSVEIRPSAGSYFGRSNTLWVGFSGSKISGIRSLDAGNELSRAELEPIPLTNLFNDDSREKQRVVHFSDLPLVLVEAVLSAEDNRFFEHHGVDPVRILGAAWTNLRRRAKVQGASTITMQTARSFFFSSQRTWRRKLEETLMALELERRFTKQKIFELYANQIYLGNRGSFSIHGFGEAAHAYFDKDVRDLSLGEAAFLAGIIRSPNRYSSGNCTPERAGVARDRVLVQLVGRRAISPEAARAASQEPLRCVEDAPERTADPYFVDMVRAQLLDRYSESELLSKRYRIYTTLDSDLERAAAEAIEFKMKDVDALLARREESWRESGLPVPEAQVALVALDPRTGAMRALVGGRNYGQSQLNRALVWRQPGSIFKPFVYAAAFSNAVDDLAPIVTPTTTVVDEPTTFLFRGKRYSPNNYQSEFHGTVTLREALIESMNVATVKLAELVGYERVAQFARKLGLGRNVQPTPLAAMGVYEMTPLDVAAAYTIFANGGARAEPLLIDRVVSPEGNVFEQGLPKVRQVLDRRVAYVVTSILEDVVNHGTAIGVRRDGFKAAAAGKTGTSIDGWFAGFTPDLVSVVWTGFDDNYDLGLTGAASATPIWTDFMERASSLTQYQSTGGFSPPEGIKVVAIDPRTLQVATPFCPVTRKEVFVDGTEPTQFCGQHTNGMMVNVPVAWWVSRHEDRYAQSCDSRPCGPEPVRTPQ
jgi:penicillin-binding protein 1B